MILTDDNYYSQEANQAYFSASQVKTFMSCPARAMAELSGEWEQPASSALLIGQMVDTAFEKDGYINDWLDAHPEVMKRDGKLKSEYMKAVDMYSRALQDDVFMEYMDGAKQVIKTGEIEGVPFKIKMDVYKEGVRIVDLKTTKDTQPLYKAGEGRLSFAEYWMWDLQGAIYQAIEGNHLPFYLAVITKEDPPGLELIEVEQEKLDAELEFLKEKLPYFNAIKMGIIEPDRCENCAYCRATRKLTGPKPLSFFGGNEFE